MHRVKITDRIRSQLKQSGIESFHGPHVSFPTKVTLEAPCSIKWMAVEHSLSMGAFSYAVSGFYSCVEMGRYCSIGEDVQIGRQDHHTNWLSTSPFQYLNTPLFDVGSEFEGASEFSEYRSHMLGKVKGMKPKKTIIGNDVWIGHGAFIKAGVHIGSGAIVAANAVVVKDVPPYAVVAGNPAAIKKFRIEEKYISHVLDAKWWDFAPWQLDGIAFNDIEQCLVGLKNLRESEAAAFDGTKVMFEDLSQQL